MIISLTDTIFYPRNAMLSRMVERSQRVCLSVTSQYCVKTKKASVMISSLPGSPKTLVFWRQISSLGVAWSSYSNMQDCRAEVEAYTTVGKRAATRWNGLFYDRLKLCSFADTAFSAAVSLSRNSRLPYRFNILSPRISYSGWLLQRWYDVV